MVFFLRKKGEFVDQGPTFSGEKKAGDSVISVRRSSRSVGWLPDRCRGVDVAVREGRKTWRECEAKRGADSRSERKGTRSVPRQVRFVGFFQIPKNVYLLGVC